MYPKRARGVAMRILDIASIAHAASTQLGCGALEVGNSPYGVAESPSGRLYAVCHEGVGWEITEDRPLVLELYAVVPDMISVVPSHTVRLSPQQVRDSLTTKFIDLADLVRVFGARLEDNFWIMHQHLTA